MERKSARAEKLTIAVILAVSAFWSASATAADIYVDASQTTVAPDGTGWGTAFPELYDALSLSQSDVGDIIHIAQGVYTPAAMGPTYISTSPERLLSFNVKRGVTVMGGYPAGGGARDTLLYTTILSGDLNANDTPILLSRTDNSTHIVLADSGVTLDGLTIQGANGDLASPSSEGGGIRASGDLTLVDCDILDNYVDSDGGGIYLTDGNLYISGGEFSYNTADNQDGGAIYFDNTTMSATCVLSISGVTFDGNFADAHGCVYASYADVSFINNTCTDNEASSEGGVIYGFRSNITIRGGSFTDNSSGSEGGVVYADNNFGPYSVDVANAVFDGNYSYDDGGVFAIYGNSTDSASLSISNCDILNTTLTNSTDPYGGVFYTYEVNISITDSLFEDNVLTASGGVYVYGSIAEFDFADYVTITNSVFNRDYVDNNYDIDGGLFFLYESKRLTVTDSVFTECDVYSDGDNIDGGIFYYYNPSVTGGRAEFTNCVFNDNDMYTDDDFYGGLLYTYNVDDVFVENCYFMNNDMSGDYYGDGGLLYFDGSGSSVIRDSVFTYNSLVTTDWLSGLVELDGFEDVLLDNCQFYSNNVTEQDYYFEGGIVSTWSCDNVVFDTVTFSGNSVNTLYDDDSDNYGGLVYCDNFIGLSITDSVFDQNSVMTPNYDYSLYGGLIYAHGASTSSNMTVTNTTFTNNDVTNPDYDLDGGIMYVDNINGVFRVDSCTFSDNTIDSDYDNVDGGMIYLYSSSPMDAVIVNSDFLNNTSDSNDDIYGGMIYSFSNNNGNFLMDSCRFDGNKALAPYYYVYGGLVYSYRNITTTITNCDFLNTYSTSVYDAYGGVLYVRSGDLSMSNVSMINSIANGPDYIYGAGLNVRSGNALILDSEFDNLTTSGSTPSEQYGGAIYAQSSSLSMSNCMIRGCSAGYGGGIYATSMSDMTLINSDISGNTATYDDENAGGLYMALVGNVLLDGVTIDGNTGRGVYIDSGADMTIDDSEITNNDSGAYDGAGAYFGNVSSLYIEGSSFEDNTSNTGNGGGVYAINVAAPVEVYDSRFTGNAAVDGGGLYVQGSDAYIYRNEFNGNAATGDGGAIRVENDGTLNTIEIVNNIIANNSAVNGGAVTTSTNSPLFIHNSVAGNTATSVGGLHATDAAVTVANSIFWNNSGEQLEAFGTASLSVTSCDIQGGFLSGTDIYNVDPLFYDEVGGNLRLSSTSPMINLGTTILPIVVADDIDQQTRTGLPDIGAHEYFNYTISGSVSGVLSAGVPVVLEPLGLTEYTDGSGSYVFTNVISGLYTLYVDAPDHRFAPPEYSFLLSDSNLSGLDFIATAAYDMSGSITGDAAGESVLLRLSGAESGSTISDAAGSYVFDDYLPGNYTITPSLPGYRFVPASLDITLSNAHVTGLDFISYREYTISGKLSGAPAPNRVVTIICPDDVRFVKADNTGNYTFTHAINGEYTIYPPDAGYGMAYLPEFKNVIVADADVTGVDFTLTNVFSIYGSAPAGTSIQVSGDATKTVISDASGNFQINALVDGSYTLTPSLNGYIFTPPSTNVLVSGANVGNVTFTAAPVSSAIYSISGQVSGVIAAGIQMTLTGDAIDVVFTDASGNYSFDLLADGSYTVTPSLDGYDFVPTDRAVTITGADETGVDFTSVDGPPQTYTVTGQVTGDVLAGVFVEMNGNSTYAAYTDATGTFVINYVLDGTYTITLSAPGYVFSPSNTAVTVNGADVGSLAFVSVENIFSLSGQVSGPASTGLTVTLSGTSLSTTVTDASGSYTFNDLAAGAYSVSLSASGYRFNPVSQVVQLSSADATGVDFSSTTVSGSLYRISGVVRGTNPAGITLALTGPVNGSVVTDAQGIFEFNGVPNGSYNIVPNGNTVNLSPAIVTVSVDNADVTDVIFSISTSSGKINSSGCSMNTRARSTFPALGLALIFLFGVALRRRAGQPE